MSAAKRGRITRSDKRLREDESLLLSRGAMNVIHCVRDALVAEARRAGCTLELVPMMGDFVTCSAPLVCVQGGGARLDRFPVSRLPPPGVKGRV